MNKTIFSLIVTLCLICLHGVGLATATEKHIAILWIGKSEMPIRVLKGFLPHLKKISPDLRVKLKTNIKDKATAEKLFREFEQSVDGIVFLRSSGAEFLATANPKVPSFVGGCNDPKFLGAVENLQAPEGKITGVTYYLPYETRFDAMKVILPKVGSLCLLLEKGHPATPIEREGTKAVCERLAITYHEVEAGSVDELVKGARDLADKVDVFVLGSQAIVMDNVPELSKVSRATKTPMFSYSEGPVLNGALAGLFARDEELGRMLADSVVDVVVKGKPVAQVPVKLDPEPCLTINESEMEFFEIKLPPSVLRNARLIGKK
jgi:putative ABC transport system substrate-binding protein